MARGVKGLIKKMLTPKDERIKVTTKSIYAGHARVTYRGVKAMRYPFDYVIYQMILSRLRPDLVIEIGTNEGGGALYLADLMAAMGQGMLHSIDIEGMVGETVRQHPRIRLFTGGWEKYDLAEAKGFKKIMVIDDGSHFYEDTLGALLKFAPLVNPGSYFIVEDGIANDRGMEKKYRGGPLKAIREFLAKDGSFHVDRAWCDFFGKNATANVNGYLKRRG